MPDILHTELIPQFYSPELVSLTGLDLMNLLPRGALPHSAPEAHAERWPDVSPDKYPS